MINYNFENVEQLENVNIKGEYRTIEINGKKGVNIKSIHSKIQINKHNLNEGCGTVSINFCSLENLSSATIFNNFYNSNPHAYNYTLLSDNKTQCDTNNATFAIKWDNGFYPQFCMKFAKGIVYPDMYSPVEKAYVAIGHFKLIKHQWYNVTATWDKAKSVCEIYINGVLAGHRSVENKGKLDFEKVKKTLFAGDPTFVLGDINFYNNVLTKEEISNIDMVKQLFKNEQLMKEIKTTYAHVYDTRIFNIDETWSTQLNLSLKNKDDIDNFYVQGCTKSVSITNEGMLISTPQEKPLHGRIKPDLTQVYVFSEKTFEGDICFEYEFMPLKRGGLSLAILFASGMHREDFMADYERRTDGAMTMLCWEDVRNYHWEYYREVNDTRRDVKSHVLIKNPWLFPMGYISGGENYKLNEWNKLQFIKKEQNIICIVNNEKIFETKDNPFINNGPDFNFGHVGIRCMVDTKMLFRNLKVHQKNSY